MCGVARHVLCLTPQVFIRAENQHVYDRDKGTFRKYEEWILDTEGINLEQVRASLSACFAPPCPHLAQFGVPSCRVPCVQPTRTPTHAQSQVLAFEGVDPQRTISNSIIEVLEVLGIEVRRSGRRAVKQVAQG